MTEGALVDRFDRIVDVVLQRRDATAALRDVELGPLAAVAADLRYTPSEAFKAGLRSGLARRAALSSAMAGGGGREGLTTVTPLVAAGGAGVAEFMTLVFGAEHAPLKPGYREVRVGDSSMLIDEGHLQTLVPLRPAEFHVSVDDADAAFERALKAGGTSLGPPTNRPYGERAGFVRDPFGNHWFIGTPLPGGLLPPGRRTLMPFFHSPGARDFMAFLQRAFGAIEERVHEGGGHVVYALMRIGTAQIEVGEADEPSMPGAFYMSVADADVVYAEAIDAGAASLLPPTDRPEGERLAAVKDPMGNHWLIARGLR